MKKSILYLIIITVITLLCFIPMSVNASEKTNITPVQAHGKLSVKGKNIVDKNGNIFQLRGVSSHAMYKYSKFLTEESFEYMRDEWKVNTIRLAIYTSTISEINPDTIQKVKDRVDYATNKGLYVIIDWHVLRDGNPNEHKVEAIEFFKDMATTYKDNVNVLYEICNEPNGVTWEDDLKPYAEELIGEIRNIDYDAIIIVGTPGYSHDIHVVADNPITEYTNIVYSYHFYAASRGDSYRTRLKETVDKGLPILISECGMVKANGDGNVDYDSAEKWIDLLDEYNIGYIVWQLTNLDEGSSLIKHEVTKLTDWTYDELSDHGKWLVDTLSKYPDDNKIINESQKNEEEKTTTHIVTFDTTGGSNIQSQEVSEGGKATRPKEPTKEGYQFYGWENADGFNTSSFDDVITKDTTFVATWLRKYEIKSGADQSFYLESDKDITIVADGPLNELADFGLYSDEDSYEMVDLEEGTDYVLENGSTKLTLKNSFLKRLSFTEYYVNFRYNNPATYGDGIAYTTLNIKTGSEPTITTDTTTDTNTTANETTTTNENTNETTETVTTISNTPKTGDSITIWISLMLVSMLGVAGTLKFVKKNKYRL